MRIVADTNIVVSGILWNGNERRLMDAARDGIIEIVSSPTLLGEFENVLSRPKFTSRLKLKNVELNFIVEAYSLLADIIITKPLDTEVSRDFDDDEVLACAVAGDCDFVVTGDSDLLVLKEYRGIRIMRAAELLLELNL
ncbi:MAG: putative toxin-antitoxin system toxin component, PIN family [Pyrinomonadaceae bacterium]